MNNHLQYSRIYQDYTVHSHHMERGGGNDNMKNRQKKKKKKKKKKSQIWCTENS